MFSPPLFRFQYKNLINAGEEQFEIEPAKWVLGIILYSFKLFLGKKKGKENRLFDVSDDSIDCDSGIR